MKLSKLFGGFIFFSYICIVILTKRYKRSRVKHFPFKEEIVRVATVCIAI